MGFFVGDVVVGASVVDLVGESVGDIVVGVIVGDSDVGDIVVGDIEGASVSTLHFSKQPFCKPWRCWQSSSSSKKSVDIQRPSLLQ